MKPLDHGEEPKKLGSLAQSARSKHLKQVRVLLLVIGIITAAFNAFQLATVREQVKKEIDKEIAKQGGGRVDPVKRQQVEDDAVRIVTPILYALIGLGALYIVFALIVHQFPVPITVIALVLYVGVNVIFAVLNAKEHPEQILSGLIIKIIIVVALIGAIKTAVAYQRERSEAREELAYDNE